LIFPLLRGRDVGKWTMKPFGSIILPIKNSTLISSKDMRILYPYCYRYFKESFIYLINRMAEPYKSKLHPYRKKSINVDESMSPTPLRHI
jgi:hypothetical protein